MASERSGQSDVRELLLSEVSDEALENAAFELRELAAHISWSDEHRAAEYDAIADHIISLGTGERLEVSQNPSAVDLFDPETTPEWVTRWRMLRDWIRVEHGERSRLPIEGYQETQPIHLRHEDPGVRP